MSPPVAAALRRGAVRPLDAIVMPTSRRLDASRSGIQLAVRLAEALGVTLVVLCSRAARAAHFPTELVRHTQVIAVDVPPALPYARHTLPTLRSDTHVISRYARDASQGRDLPEPVNDAGPKRNLGLALARLFGWSRVLFLDDDVFQPTWEDRDGSGLLADLLEAALDQLPDDGPARAVGWTLDDFPDNSVVCHARALAGFPQGQFLGGGALLVKIDSRLPFFPSVYNEDWLFLLPLIAYAKPGRPALVQAGTLKQDPYKPFTVRRARSEELGDVLGEGLMTLAPGGPRALRALSTDPDFWARALSDRRRMIDETVTRLAVACDTPDRWGRSPAEALVALRAALALHDERPDWHEDLARYCRTWYQDLDTWGSWFRGLEPDPHPLKALGLDPSSRTFGRPF